MLALVENWRKSRILKQGQAEFQMNMVACDKPGVIYRENKEMTWTI